MNIQELFGVLSDVKRTAGEMVASVKSIAADLRDFKRHAKLPGASAQPRLQYSKQEAARMLDCSDRWLDTLEADYGLRSHKIGNKRFYSHAELVRFVNDQQAIQTETMILEMVGVN